MFSFSQIHDAFDSAVGFVKNNKTWLLQGATCLAVVGVEAAMTYHSLVNDGYGIEYAIARSCGAAIKIISLAAMFPLSRVAYTHAQNSQLGQYLGLDRRIIDHQIISTALIVAASVHAGAHFLYNPANYFMQPGITGVIMLGGIMIPIGGTLLLKRHVKSLQIFGYGISMLRTHQVGVGIFLASYLMHTSDYRLLKYAAVACLPLAIDRLVEKLVYTHITQLKHAFIANNTDFMSVSVKRPPLFSQAAPGQYALLSFRNIDKLLEPPHPFTIAQLHRDKITFLIKRTGPWTGKLYEHLQQLSGQPTPEWEGIITGPFGQSLLNHCMTHAMTFIGTGIGITPILAILHYILTGEILPKRVSLQVVQRKLDEAQPCIDLINQIDERASRAISTIDIYLTREATHPSHKTAILNMHGFFAHKVKVHYQRPNFNNIIATAEAVHACGSPEVVKIIQATARRYGKICNTESF